MSSEEEDNKMQLVQSYFLKRKNIDSKTNHFIISQMRFAKSMYNQMLYYVRNWYNFYCEVLTYFDLNKMLNKPYNPYQKFLKTDISDSTLQTYAGTIKSYYASLFDFFKNPKKYSGMPKFPKYIESDLYYFCIRGRNVKIENRIIMISNSKKKEVYSIPIPIDEYKKEFEEKVNQIRFYPINKDLIRIEIIYEKEKRSILQEGNAVMGIDLGVNNLASCITTNSNLVPLILSGKELKSINHLWNVRMDDYKSIAKKRYDIDWTTNRLKNYNLKRSNRIKSIFHVYTTFLIDYCDKNKIGTIVVGGNKLWKSEIKQKNKDKKMKKGKSNPMYYRKTRRTFVEIPFDLFKKKLQYKCDLKGIKLIFIEESYTSMVDNLRKGKLRKYGNDDNGEIVNQRKSRGLFETSDGKRINADINGAIGILRKAIGDTCVDAISLNKFICNPKKIRYCDLILNCESC